MFIVVNITVCTKLYFLTKCPVEMAVSAHNIINNSTSSSYIFICYLQHIL